MILSPTLQVIITDNAYCQIATDMFQGYAKEQIEGKLLWKSIKIDFKH